MQRHGRGVLNLVRRLGRVSPPRVGQTPRAEAIGTEMPRSRATCRVDGRIYDQSIGLAALDTSGSGCEQFELTASIRLGSSKRADRQIASAAVLPYYEPAEDANVTATARRFAIMPCAASTPKGPLTAPVGNPTARGLPRASRDSGIEQRFGPRHGAGSGLNGTADASRISS